MQLNRADSSCRSGIHTGLFLVGVAFRRAAVVGVLLSREFDWAIARSILLPLLLLLVVVRVLLSTSVGLVLVECELWTILLDFVYLSSVAVLIILLGIFRGPRNL